MKWHKTNWKRSTFGLRNNLPILRNNSRTLRKQEDLETCSTAQPSYGLTSLEKEIPTHSTTFRSLSSVGKLPKNQVFTTLDQKSHITDFFFHLPTRWASPLNLSGKRNGAPRAPSIGADLSFTEKLSLEPTKIYWFFGIFQVGRDLIIQERYRPSKISYSSMPKPKKLIQSQS